MTIGTKDLAAARRGLLLVVLAGVLWGTSGVTTKALYGLTETTPASVAALRLALAAPVLLAVSWRALGRRAFDIAPVDFALMLVAGSLMGASQTCYFSAISRTGVAVATLVTVCTSPLLVFLLSALLLKERLTGTVVGALAGALLGTVLLIDVGGSGTGSESSTLEGTLLALAAGLGSALLILAGRRLARRCDPLLSISVAVTMGATLLFTLSSVTSAVVLSYPLPGWLLLLYLGLVPTALAYAIFFRGMRRAAATAAGIATLAEPLTGAILAVLIFGEQLSALGLLGATLLVGSILSLYRNGSSS